MRRTWIGMTLLCVTLSGCALAPQVSRARVTGWHSLRHASFLLMGDAPPEELRRLGSDLALFDRVFALLARMPTEPLDPVSIFVISDPELARHFGLAGSVAGWMVATLEGSFAAVEAGRTHVETRATLLHEYTHALLRRNRRGPLPPWYDEGLSSYFSTFSVREGGVVVGVVPSAEIDWLASRGPLPLARLFEGSASGQPPTDVNDFYATAWALAHLQLATPRGRRELATFAVALERGDPWRAAEAAAFGRPVEALQAELESHVKLLARGVAAEAVIDRAELDPSTRLEVSPLSPGEVAYALGFLALQVGDMHPQGSLAPLSRALFTLALREGGSAARTEAGLAEALALEGDWPAAQPLAERALARDPEDLRVHLAAGRVALARADAAAVSESEREAALGSALEHTHRALAIDPASATAWTQLGKTRRLQGRSDEAQSAFERARGLGWSPQIDLALGALYLEGGRRDEALALLWPLAGDPHGGSASEEARSRLEAAGLMPRDAAADP